MSTGPNANTTTLISPSQQISVALFITQSLQTNWQTLEIDLGDGNGKKPYTRKECRDFLDKQITQISGPGQRQKIGDLDSFASLEHANYVLVNEAYQQEADRVAFLPENEQKAYLGSFKTNLGNYQRSLSRLAFSTLESRNSEIPSIDLVRQATLADKQLQSQLGSDIEKIAAANTHGFYPEDLKKIAGAKLNQAVQQAAYRYLANGKELDKEFIDKEVRRIVRQSPYLSAAIGSEQRLMGDLAKAVAKTDKTTFLANYNQVRSLQLGMDPCYHPLLYRLTSAGLTAPEARKVIDEFSSHSGNLALGSQLHTYQSQFFLRQALAKYDHLKISPDTLAFEFAHLGQISGSAPGYLTGSARSLNTTPQALHAYLRGLTPEQLRNFGQEDLAKQTEALQKALGDPKATAALKTHEQQLKKTQLEELHQEHATAKTRKEKKAIKEKIKAVSQDKVSDVDRALKQRQTNEKMQKDWKKSLDKKLKHEHFLHTTKRGKALQAFNKTAGFAGKAMDVPANVFSYPGRFASKQFANALMRLGARDAAVNYIEHGFKGLIGNVLTKSFLGKQLGGKLFASIFGGAIGTTIAIGSTIAQNWKQILQGLGPALYGLYYLLSQIPTTLLLGGVGLAFGGPVGMLVGAGLGYAIDSTVGLAKAATAVGQGAASVASQTTALATSIGQGSTPVSFIAVPVFTPLGVAAGFTLFLNTIFFPAIMQTTDAKEVGGGIDAPKNTVDYEDLEIKTPNDCQDPGCTLAFALKKCGAANLEITKTTWNYINLDCLKQEGISQEAIGELHHSVFDIPGNSALQCVGFKRAAEVGKGLPSGNAVSFLDWKGNYDPNNPGSIEVGANAIWGPRAGCSSQDPKIANTLCNQEILCCGHIGIVSKIDTANNLYYVTSAWGDAGKIDVIKFSIFDSKQTGGPWKFVNP